MKKILAIVASAIVLAACTGGGSDKVRLAVDVPYEPFEYKAPDGSLTGFEIELGNAVCEEMGVECEWVIQGWDGIIPGLLANKYDAIFSSMSITPERAEKVAFSEGYYNTPSGWFAPKNANIDVTSLADKRIGVQRGTIQDDHATENPAGAEVVRYDTADELVLDLYGGRLDVVLLDFPVGESTILGGEKGSEFETVSQVQLGDGAGVALRKSDTELLEKFNTALRTVKGNGVYDEIRKKYFSYDIKI